MNKQGSKSYLLRDSQSLSDFRHNERDIINYKLSSRQPFNSITNLHQLSAPKRLPSFTSKHQHLFMQTPIKPPIGKQKPTSSSKSDNDDDRHHRFYSIQTLSQTPNLKSTTNGRNKTQTQMTFSELRNPNQKGQLYLFQTPKEEKSNNKRRKSSKQIEINQEQQYDQSYSKYQTRKSKAASGSNSSKKSKSSKKGGNKTLAQQDEEERKIAKQMIRTPEELEGIHCSPEESANKQYIMNLKIALKETIDQNESLLQEVALLRDQVQSLTNEKKQRDDAIVQLTQALVNLQIKYGEEGQQQQDQMTSPRIQEMLSRNQTDQINSEQDNKTSIISYQKIGEDEQHRSQVARRKSKSIQKPFRKTRRLQGNIVCKNIEDLDCNVVNDNGYLQIDSDEDQEDEDEEEEQDYISI